MKRQCFQEQKCWLSCFFNFQLILAIIMLASCGDDFISSDDNSDPDTGSYVFSLGWPDGVPTLEDSTFVSKQVDCNVTGIVHIVAYFYDVSDNLLKDPADRFDCLNYYGKVQELPAGDNYRLFVTGENSDGDVLYEGEVTGIKITAGVLTKGGVIEMRALYPWVEIQKLTSPDSAAGDNFGESVSIYGEYAIVGASFNDDNGPDSGSVYIFKKNVDGWTETQKFTAFDGVTDDHFGQSVFITADYAIVGAPYADANGDDSGAVYILKKDVSGWMVDQKLTASDGAANDWFGSSVSLSGDTAIVGASNKDDNGENSGSAYIFTKDVSGWVEVQKLTAPDGSAYDEFGHSVSISGNMISVGAPFDDNDNGNDSGAVYIFEKDIPDWELRKIWTGLYNKPNDKLGSSLSMSGDYLVSGAPLHDYNELTDSGVVCIHKNDANYGLIDKGLLVPTDGSEGELFGESVSLSSNYAIAGTRLYDNGSGAAYVITKKDDDFNLPDETQWLTAEDGADWDYFGASVSISGNYAIVGAPYHDALGTDSGAAYIFMNINQ